MTLSPGARLGPHSITGAIGAGGMGEVSPDGLYIALFEYNDIIDCTVFPMENS